jgi:hypothetical protein
MDVITTELIALLTSLIAAIKQGLIYDLFKIIVGFIFARFIYERFIMQFLWGGWSVKVIKNNISVVSRDISPSSCKRILSDETELSVYLKGIISPYEWLKIDIVSPVVIKAGVLITNKKQKIITVNLDQISDNLLPQSISLHTSQDTL